MATVTLLFLMTDIAPAVQQTRRRQHPYRKHWRHSLYGKPALARTGAKAAIVHNGGGFGQRLATGFGVHAVKTTVEHAVAAPLHEDLHYHRSNKRGFGLRLKHALLSTVITRNTRTNKRAPAAGRLSGHAAAGALSQAWLPAASGASTAGIGLAADAGANVAREFWPHKPKNRERRSSKRRHTKGGEG